MVKYNDREVTIINERRIEDELYYDILFQERNVELDSLFSIGDNELKENTYAIYVKAEYLEIVVINKIDLQFNNVQIQIYKSNISSKCLT